MVLAPTVESFSQAMDSLHAVLEQGGCSAKARMALEAALEEAFMNIVHHAGATAVDVTVTRTGDELTLRLVDDGVAFNPLRMQPPDITLPAQARAIGGLGVLMIRRMTDWQTYTREQGHNVLTLGRSLRDAPVQPADA